MPGEKASSRRLQVGVNYPWRNYGWDFGAPPCNDDGSAWGPRAAWRATLDRELSAFADLGLFAVRWFILGDGLTYGIGAQRPHPDAAQDGQWRFDDPPPLSAEFEEDYVFLLQRVAASPVKLLPSLLDFHFCYPALTLPGVSGYVKQGRSDVLIDSSKRERFFSRVLDRLLHLSAPYRDAIYAFELMNEPEWCTNASLFDWFRPKRIVPVPDMLTFLRDGVRRINAAGFRSTVGFAFHATLSAWDSPGLGITLHQFHYYATPGELPVHDFDPRWPAIVGELATAPHHPWAELGADQGLGRRLQLIESKGYPAAFLWSAEQAPDREQPPASDWSAATQAAVRRFTIGGE